MKLLRAAFLALALPVTAAAQTQLGLTPLEGAAEAPLEVTAESLDVDRESGTATFRGDVLVVQGELRLAAPEMVVRYSEEEGTQGISSVEARGGVLFTTPDDAAEADEAVYSVAASELVLSGNVVMNQGPNTLSGERLVLDLATGTGQIEGRVRTLFQPSSD